MNVRPLHDRIVVRRFEEGEQSVGGIIIPDMAKEKPQRGTVIAAGSVVVKDGGAFLSKSRRVMDRVWQISEPGDHARSRGLPHMREDEVLAVIEIVDKAKLPSPSLRREHKSSRCSQA